jgi:hypothetical protein
MNPMVSGGARLWGVDLSAWGSKVRIHSLDRVLVTWSQRGGANFAPSFILNKCPTHADPQPSRST